MNSEARTERIPATEPESTGEKPIGAAQRFLPWVVAVGSVIPVGAQVVVLPPDPTTTALDLVGEGVVVAVLFACLFVVRRVHAPSVFYPLAGGVAASYLFALTDFLDEFVEQPVWFSYLFEDGAQAVGAALLVFGIYRWTVARQRRETELRQQREQLAVLNRVLHHDIRNDALVIRGWASVVRKEAGSAADERLENIVAASNGIIDLTESTAQFTDVLTSERTADLEPKPLAETIETELRKARAAHDADVVVSGDLPDVDVLAHSMLSAVFRNLLVTAVERADAERPRIRLRAERGAETVTVRISDDGPPFPEDAFPDAGETVAGSPESRSGLSLVAALVEQFDGTVAVENDPDGGVTVAVRLKLAEHAATSPADRVTEGVSDTESSSSASRPVTDVDADDREDFAAVHSDRESPAGRGASTGRGDAANY
ncbi:sensor histidine kinase [Haloferax sp. Atlit-10N]|uniref:sensor histidine kinase n=1 Tax=unclassified Haloferax TaxID=2625095 RepID=UPI000E21CB5D|nr:MULTISPECIES: HAMP domain-containing sensor histidine kinase [unclassified Haloferax]RDZ40221.1 sensor histidine kinase [Haloferax sp. Atlit-16N]RDZ56851.1 sensor histidine kinase [Haloferax sp. Atlit-10N]